MSVVYRTMLSLAVLGLGTSLSAAESDPTEYVRREFKIDAAMFSYLPGKELESYKWLGSGMAEARSSLGLGAGLKGTSFVARILPQVKHGRFVVTIDMEPPEAKKKLGFEAQTRDMSDLKPITIQLPSENDRVYQINVTPGIVITDFTPKQLNVADLQLHNWHFPDS